jgi:hypothetical protein
MIQLFQPRAKQVFLSTVEDEVRRDIQRRADINAVARKEALKLAQDKAAKNVVATSKIVSKEDMLKTLDNVLNAVGGYENSKITALTELYLAIESGDTKELIQFLKKKDAPVVKKSKSKKVWES